jgi:hypothetical protein
MYLKWQPIVFDQELPFQSFDNTFADVTKGSDIIGVDSDFYGCHMRLPFSMAAPRLPFFAALGGVITFKVPS